MSNNLKKLTLLILATCAPFSISYANSAFDCFYAGIGIGESLASARSTSSTRVTVTEGGSVFSTGASFSQSLKKSSFAGTLFGGYGYSCACFYLGGELSFKITHHDAVNENTISTANTIGSASVNITERPRLNTRKFEIDLDARPGFLLSDCSMLYGRIGVAFSRHNHRRNLNAFFNVDDGEEFTDSIPLSLAQSSKKNTGLRLGFGMEQMFAGCFSVRLDYVYTLYKRFNASTSTTVTPTATTGTIQHTTSLKPRNQTWMLGLSYYW